jgi:hypothetical protein
MTSRESHALNAETTASEGSIRPFLDEIVRQTRLLDLLAVGLVPVVLTGIYTLPRETREAFVFETENPTILTAYTSYFVHLDWFHLLGNLVVYFPAVVIAYLLCVLSNRRTLFGITFLTLLVAFPFVLSAMQLIFPRERLLLGFSGITAGIVGLACFALVGYVRTALAVEVNDRYAPTLLFFTTALIASIAVPSGAYRTAITLASIGLGTVYLGFALVQNGLPSRDTLTSAANRRGYFAFTGAAVGLLVGYPFVAFQTVLIPEGGILNVYVHLLGYNLVFIVVFSFVALVER